MLKGMSKKPLQLLEETDQEATFREASLKRYIVHFCYKLSQ